MVVFKNCGSHWHLPRDCRDGEINGGPAEPSVSLEQLFKGQDSWKDDFKKWTHKIGKKNGRENVTMTCEFTMERCVFGGERWNHLDIRGPSTSAWPILSPEVMLMMSVTMLLPGAMLVSMDYDATEGHIDVSSLCCHWSSCLDLWSSGSWGPCWCPCCVTNKAHADVHGLHYHQRLWGRPWSVLLPETILMGLA